MIKVRLPDDYIEYIKELALEYFESKDVWIFGSRADLNEKGGDIDIYIETKLKEDTTSRRLRFLTKFGVRFGEQKVDLIIKSPTLKNIKIFDVAKSTGVKL
jgi:predicted nucleotidyltransferase